jgi:hypothetical protein
MAMCREGSSPVAVREDMNVGDRRAGREDYSGWKAEKMIEVMRSAISALGIFTSTLSR